MYTENPELSENTRHEYASAVEKLICRLENESDRRRSEFVSSHTRAELAEKLRNMLGFPLNMPSSGGNEFSKEYVAHDDLCEIYRVRLSALPDFPVFGMLFVPRMSDKPAPLIIALHGALGTPELMYGMHGKNGYNNIIRRFLSRGSCVFAPQLLIWNCGQSPAKPRYGTSYNRTELDRRLKNLGGGMTALEVFSVLSFISPLTALPEIDGAKIGLYGMSFGAYLGLFAMALDERIRASYLSSCFNDRQKYAFPDWQYKNYLNTFCDAEVAALCAPRKLFIEVGSKDDLFELSGAEHEAERALEYYKIAGAEENFRLNVWSGGHIVSPEDGGIDFLLSEI